MRCKEMIACTIRDTELIKLQIYKNQNLTSVLCELVTLPQRGKCVGCINMLKSTMVALDSRSNSHNHVVSIGSTAENYNAGGRLTDS